jgi:hypothetical protein
VGEKHWRRRRRERCGRGKKKIIKERVVRVEREREKSNFFLKKKVKVKNIILMK